MIQKPIDFYHAPQSRSGGVRIAMEELGAPYNLHLINLRASEQRKPDYLAINPMGKVPAIIHNDELITEQVAIYLYLGDAFPEKKLTPAIGEKLRGSYLRWMVFYAACFEPAIVDKALERDAGKQGMSPYGSYEQMLGTLSSQLNNGYYILGNSFTLVDVLWASALRWTTAWKLVPVTPTIEAYVARCFARPAFMKAMEDDANILKLWDSKSSA